MAVTTRLGLTLLAEATEQKATVLNTDLNLLDAGAALLGVTNAFTAESTFSQAPAASVQRGVVNVGNGGFAGAAGGYAGSASGSFLAVNAVSGFAGDLVNAQTNGTSAFRVTGDAKIGVYGVTPVVRSAAYTVTNPTTDRALNVTADTLAQVAQVLGTLIADLKAIGWIG